MRSPLELLEGRFDHALLTTYSFNLRFFEEWVLRALWAAEVRNVVVFVDPGELAEALADRAPSLAGRAYHLVAATQARAAFHPKLLLASGPDGARLCVSSANLTPDGQLRNAESAIAFDASLAGHSGPILEAAELFRRLSEGTPPYTAAAIQAALAVLPGDTEESPYHLVHNLDDPLIDAFPPTGPTQAVAPYVDADGGAASALQERGQLTVIVDGEQIAASADFFAAPWDVDARKFEARLHGKTYEVSTPEGQWTLVGSPNLSAPALLQPAQAGNLEVAIAVRGQDAIELPANSPWLQPGLDQEAAARLTVASRETEFREAAPRAFNAWEDERLIRVTGVPEGTRIERWVSDQWQLLGTVTDGAVLIGDPEIRPTRLRAVTDEGRVAFAAVGQPAILRARMRARARGRETDSIEKVPLDLEAVRVLEEVLSHLYTLSEQAGQAQLPVGRPRAEQTPEESKGLLEWMPRSPEEEPRIPPIYVNKWKGEPDAFLALIRKVLRVEPEQAGSGEAEVGLEDVELEDLGEVTSEEEVGVAPTDDAPHPEANREDLLRYRRAFQKLFERGEDFLTSTADPTLAGSAFVYLLHLVEELGLHRVEVEGRRERLMPRKELRGITLELLERYLRRGERDPLCLATARVHLAAAMRERPRYSARDVERLDALAYTWAAELIELSTDLPAPAKESLGLDTLGAIAWLDDYADRSRWDGVLEKAEQSLDAVHIVEEPWPMVVGSASFSDRMHSPAWVLLKFAGPVGYATPDPFGIAVLNEGESPVEIHVLICAPEDKRVVEAWKRNSDGAWVERHYGAPTRSAVEKLTGPGDLDVTMSSTERERATEGSDEFHVMIDTLERARTAN